MPGWYAWRGRAEPSRAEPRPSRTEPNWAKPNRAEPARDPKLNFVPAYGDVILLVFFRYLPNRMLTFWTTFPRASPADLGHRIGGPSRGETRLSQAEPSRAEPGRTGLRLAGPGWAEPSRAEQRRALARAEPRRAAQNRAEPTQPRTPTSILCHACVYTKVILY